jgi:O-antigen/teichoic acid export membrane protein
MAVAVLVIPVLVRSIGVPRFGVLSLAWILIGYFSLFDLGMGRALTKLVADKLGRNEETSIPALVWTALALLLGLGVLGGGTVALLSRWLVFHVLNIPEALRTESFRSFYLLALSLPMVTGTSGLRGILEAQQRFGVLNAIRVPMSIFSFAGPPLVLPFSNRLVPIIFVLITGRLLAGLAHLAACLHSIPGLREIGRLRKSVVLSLFRFGGWMTISNLVGPIMTYLDRFMIGALLTVSAVAYYTVPFDFVGRFSIIPGAVAGVLFPAFALAFARDSTRAGLLLSRGVKYIFLAMFPMILVIATFAPEGLRLWLGPTFAGNGGTVLRWLATGMFVSCLAQVPFAFIQGCGRPDITAKLHLLELPLYLLALWPLIRLQGIQGAAIAWTSRVVLDATLLFGFSHRLLPHRPRFLANLGIATAGSLLLFCLSSLPTDPKVKFSFLVLTIIVFGLAAWFFSLTAEERAFMLRAKPSSRAIGETLGDAL